MESKDRQPAGDPTADALVQEIRRLRQELQERDLEVEIIRGVIAQAAQQLGLDPAAGDIKSQLIKRIPKFITRFMLDPDGMSQQFSFFQELGPILEKYSRPRSLEIFKTTEP